MNMILTKIDYSTIWVRVLFVSFMSMIIVSNTDAQDVVYFIELAEEVNPGLKALKLDYLSSKQKANQVDDFPDPRVSVGLGVFPVETRLGAQRLKIGVTQAIPWSGLLDAQSNVATAKAEIKSNMDDIKKIDIEYTIRTAYSKLIFIAAQVDIINEKLYVLESLQAMAKSGVRSGKGKLSNVLLIERKRELLDANINLLKKQKEQPTILINRWCGRELLETIDISEPISNEFTKLDLVTNIRQWHPLIIALENKKLVSTSEIELTKYQSKPKIGVGLDYSWIEARDDVDIAGNGRDVLMPMGSISIPLNTGRYSAKRQEERLKQESIQAQIDDLSESYRADIESAYNTIEYNEMVVAKYKSLKTITSETIKLMRTEYAAEGTRFEELMRLEMELIDYNLEIIKAQYQVDMALATLNKYKYK